MSRIFTRKAAAVAGAATLALALAACTPPNENPSDLKVDTATEFQAPAGEADSSSSVASSSEFAEPGLTEPGVGEPTEAETGVGTGVEDPTVGEAPVAPAQPTATVTG